MKLKKNVSDHNHEKYISTTEFNNLTARVFTARLAQTNLVTKTDFDNKLQSLDKNINSNKTKHLLVKTELKNLEKLKVGYFISKHYFDGDDTQNYLVFRPV